MKLYDNIRNLRIERGWSQDDLAHRAGYSDRSMITRIEKGSVDLSHSKILLFADIFNVDPVELMGLSDADEVCLSPSENRLVRTFRLLDSADQEEVIRFVNFKASEPKYREEGLQNA